MAFGCDLQLASGLLLTTGKLHTIGLTGTGLSSPNTGGRAAPDEQPSRVTPPTAVRGISRVRLLKCALLL